MIKYIMRLPWAKLSKFGRKVTSGFSSPSAVATVKMAIAVVTLFQAIDALKDSKRQIGFKPSLPDDGDQQ